MQGIYMGEMFCISVVIIILQIVLYNQLIKQGGDKTKLWNILEGISIAAMIADIAFVIFTIINSFEMNVMEGALLAFIGLGSIGTHFGLFMAGICKRIDMKNENIRCTKNFVISILIAMLILGVAVVIPKIAFNRDLRTEKWSAEINYLKEKYGEREFKVIREKDKYEVTQSMQDAFAGRKTVIYVDLEILETSTQTKFTLHSQSGKYTDDFAEQYKIKIRENSLVTNNTK